MGTNKTDMERVGLFQEMKYHTIGDPYRTSGLQVRFNEAAGKGKQLHSGISKEKAGNADGYFENFNRVFTGEAYSDPIKLRRLQRQEEAKKRIAKDWVPSSNPKKSSGIGSHFGTFSGNISSFSAVSRTGGGQRETRKNVMTNPGRQGTGYGYIGVTIGKYPEYKGDSYDRNKEIMRKELDHHKSKVSGKSAFRLNLHPVDYFDMNPYRSDKVTRGGYRELPKVERPNPPFRPSNPGKKPGGAKAGTLEPFPTYSSDPYIKKTTKSTDRNSSGKIFMPNSGPKSAPSSSIVCLNAVRTMNIQNYRTAQLVRN